MFNAIHVTHEAVYKVGGIGTVLEGLINSRPVPRRRRPHRARLPHVLSRTEGTLRLGPGGIIEYSSLDQIYNGPYADAFRQVERDFGVRLAYGRRPLEDGPTGTPHRLRSAAGRPPRGMNLQRVNALKGQLYEHYGLRSDRYQHIWEFEQYVQVAPPAVAALEAMHLATDDAPAVVFAHEFMGVPNGARLARLLQPAAPIARCSTPTKWRRSAGSSSRTTSATT